MNPIWFLRMARWAKRPPSEARVKFVLAIIAVCVILFGIERYFGWPEWLTANRPPGVRISR